MKKIMIMVGAVAMAVAASAASMDWSIGTKAFLMSDGTTQPKGTTVYLMDTGAANYTALLAALTNGTGGKDLATVMASTLFTSSSLASATTYSSANKTLMNNNYGKVAKTTATVATAGASSNYSIFVADGEKYLISAAVAGKSYATDPNDGVEAAFAPADFSSKTWATYSTTPEPTPEPTSGLLLLLGVAGLALKRKHA